MVGLVKGMDRISGLSDELLVRILSFVPTKVAVSTSILSKRWEFLWTWVPKLEFVDNKYGSDLAIRDFINKNLPLLKPPVIETFRLKCFSPFPLEDITQWVGITVSRLIVELDIDCQYYWSGNFSLLLPSSLYTCESLLTLKLKGEKILLDVPRTVSLPKLKTLYLGRVTYLNNDCFRLLISYCPVLEDLVVERNGQDNTKTIAVEEADICVEYYLFNIFDSITSVKRLSLCVSFNIIPDEKDIRFKKYEPINWNSSEISVPTCLLESLETFEYAEYRGSQEERDFVSFIIKHACRLKSSTITPCTGIETYSVSESSDES
ncbi:hypothetical protein Bca101_081598 [Brassica carinata]